MLTYEEMQYFVAFADSGTLTKVADRFTISQPTITRAMQKAEEVFGVPLFSRTRNSIRLNDNGVLAAEEIRRLLRQTEEAVDRVRAHDRASRTISLGSAAAVPIPGLIAALNRRFPEKAIATELKLPAELLDGLGRNVYQLIVLPSDPNAGVKPASRRYCTCAIGEEHLMFLLPKKHRFAGRKSLTLREMDGENMLLYSEIGFWADIVRQKMPHSRFLVQSERYSMNELIANSVLPCFTTDLVNQDRSIGSDRVAVPIRDPEVNVTYYLAVLPEREKEFSFLLRGRHGS